MMLMIKFSLRVHLCNQSVSISVLFSQYEATARRVEPLGMCVCVHCRQRTSYGALVTLDECLPYRELVKDRCGQRARTAHGRDRHLLLKGEWYGHRWTMGGEMGYQAVHASTKRFYHQVLQ